MIVDNILGPGQKLLAQIKNIGGDGDGDDFWWESDPDGPILNYYVVCEIIPKEPSRMVVMSCQ